MLARTIIDFNNPVKADERCNKNPTLSFKTIGTKRWGGGVRMYAVGLGKCGKYTPLTLRRIPQRLPYVCDAF